MLRALQERVTDALRHSGSTRIEVRIRTRQAGPSEACTEISVRDDGSGMALAKNPSGRGIKSLKMCARKLGGVLVVEPQQPGLRVAIKIQRVPPNSRDVSMRVFKRVHYMHHKVSCPITGWSGFYVHPIESLCVFITFNYTHLYLACPRWSSSPTRQSHVCDHAHALRIRTVAVSKIHLCPYSEA